MKRIPLVAALFVMGVVFFLPQSSLAQRARYGFSRPPMSDWLNLERRDTGLLDSYNANVRPQQQLRQTLNRQQAAIQRQNAGMRSLGQRLSAFERPQRVRATGTGSTFMNYSHYYSSRSSGRRGR